MMKSQDAEAALTVLAAATRRLSSFAVKARNLDRLKRADASDADIERARLEVVHDPSPDMAARELASINPGVEVPPHRQARLLSLRARLQTVADWLNSWGGM